MKKLFIGLMALALAFTAVVSLTSCEFGLKEVDFEDIPKAKLFEKYTVETVTYTKASDSSSTTNGEMTGEQVRLAIAGTKTAIEAAKILYSKSYGEVKANSNYSKIVTYFYTKNSDNELVTRVVTTYKKK
jgi:hypothetical protein